MSKFDIWAIIVIVLIMGAEEFGKYFVWFPYCTAEMETDGEIVPSRYTKVK